MSDQEEMSEVGQVVLRKDECFWILPNKYIFRWIPTYSPWFSYMGVKWRLFKDQQCNEYSIPFRLWQILRDPSKYDYSVRLGLESLCHQFHESTNDVDPDYGCAFHIKLDCIKCNSRHPIGHILSYNGLVKISFFIHKKEKNNISTELSVSNKAICDKNENTTNDTENIDVEENDDDKENDDDEEATEDEESSKDKKINEKKKAASETKGIDRLVQDLKNLLLNGWKTDITLNVKDREFKAHRNILMARSAVFASMLQHDTKESTTGVVDIPDCAEDAFEVFLTYIYTGLVDTISPDNIFNLYYAADKYQINDLKSECVDYMMENLSVENFCSTMTLSLQHSELGLQKKAIKFFCDNVKIIIKTVQWLTYVKDFPIQANELYIKAMNA